MGGTCSINEVENVPAALAKGGDTSEHSLGEAASAVTLGAHAGFAPNDSGANGALCLVIRGLDSIGGDEGPQGRLELENASAKRFFEDLGRERSAELDVDGEQVTTLGLESIGGMAANCNMRPNRYPKDPGMLLAH